jgi:peptidoglycan-N-acetylglucosamine deacetylase
VEPSFLLHPLDLLGGDQVPQLAFFPGMDLPHRRKAALFERVLGVLGEHFTLVPMGEHAAAIEARRNLPARVPVLAA